MSFMPETIFHELLHTLFNCQTRAGMNIRFAHQQAQYQATHTWQTLYAPTKKAISRSTNDGTRYKHCRWRLVPRFVQSRPVCTGVAGGSG